MTLNQIRIKNIDKWNSAKSKDFVGKKQDYTDLTDVGDSVLMTNDEDDEQTMTINEEVKTTEYAPAIFEAIRKMDNVTDAMIQKSLNTELNR